MRFEAQQLKPNITYFEQNINICHLEKTRTLNVFTKEIFKFMLTNVKFELRCPFKKGVYQRDSREVFNYTSTVASDSRLTIPSYLSFGKEIMLKFIFSTKVDGYPEIICAIEETHKFIDVA